MSKHEMDSKTVSRVSAAEQNNRKFFEDICKERIVYVSEKIKNDSQMLEEAKKAINDVPQAPNRTTEEIHTITTENHERVDVLWKISIEEALTYGLADVSDAVTYSGKVVAISSYKIAESILIASRNIAPILERYIDVVERKNMLDEYYMLLNDIEKYELALMELGCIKDAYDNLELIQYPTIEIDERGIWMLINMINEDTLNKIISVSKQSFTNPFKMLHTYIENHHKWKLRICESEEYQQIVLKCADLTIPVMAKQDSNWNLKFDGISSSLFNRDYTNRDENPFWLLSRITTYDGFAKEALEYVYNSINEKSLEMMFMNDSYSTVVNGINSINQAIQLTNLRSLHSALRSQVRKYRIEKCLSGK